MSAGLSASVRHLTREKDEEDGVEGGGWGGFGECDPRGDAEWYAEDDADVAACLFLQLVPPPPAGIRQLLPSTVTNICCCVAARAA